MADLQTTLVELEKAVSDVQEAATALEPQADPLRKVVEDQLTSEGWTAPVETPTESETPAEAPADGSSEG